MVKGKFGDRESGRIDERNRVTKYVTLSSWSSFHLPFAKRLSLQLDPMRPVENSIQDRIGDCRLLQILMPGIRRELRSDDRRVLSVAILDHLQEVMSFLGL